MCLRNDFTKCTSKFVLSIKVFPINRPSIRKWVKWSGTQKEKKLGWYEVLLADNWKSPYSGLKISLFNKANHSLVKPPRNNYIINI